MNGNRNGEQNRHRDSRGDHQSHQNDLHDPILAPARSQCHLMYSHRMSKSDAIAPDLLDRLRARFSGHAALQRLAFELEDLSMDRSVMSLAFSASIDSGGTIAEYREMHVRIREWLPEAAVTSDFIVGFCGETEEDFELSCELVRECRFKNSFIFKYSPRPGTVAIDRFADDVPEDAKRRRNRRPPTRPHRQGRHH